MVFSSYSSAFLETPGPIYCHLCNGLLPQCWKVLYFSSVPFTALGYSTLVGSEGISPTRGTGYLGVVHSLFSSSLMDIFLVIFIRKMSR